MLILSGSRKALGIFVAAFLLSAVPRLDAGGVKYVAGVTSFDPNVAGKPITWANGNLVYFTDQGNAGPMLPQSAANTFVADAFAAWTSVPTAGLKAARGGALAEDVNGTNVTSTQSGISLPLDIQPTAAAKPLAIVYDNDGAVIDALMGAGASDPSMCATNSVMGGVDKFSTDAHFTHALIIINGRCAQNSSDLPSLRYHLVRLLGQVLGLGWSQANDNVRSGSPPANSQDFAGFPLMHPMEPFCFGAITDCIPNADQLRMDDRAAATRLYPVTALNISSFSGKQISAASTIRIRGSVYFSDVHGNSGQPMQGVNVVARLIDKSTGMPSRSSVATSVSGFLFHGNNGNHISGFGTTTQLYNAFGSADTGLEGFYDLGGLELPPGETTASYQITVEQVEPSYAGAATVGPYGSSQITPSGTAPVIILADLSAGADVLKDIVMSGNPKLTTDVSEPNSFATPSPVPSSGQWWGSLSGYGDEDFFTFSAKANRTFDFQVIALDETLSPTSGKAHPELGVWRPSDLTAPQLMADAFNRLTPGLTELAGDVSAAGKLKLGIADFRGDGRPDFLYRARLLYADTITPERLALSGGNVIIRGIGFRQGLSLDVGTTAASVIAIDENQLVATLPAMSGTQNVTITAPQTGAVTTMKNAVTFGLLSTDQVQIVSSGNPPVAVGTDAPNPVVVRAVAADSTPLAGVNVTFTVTPTQSLFPLCAKNVCNVVTDINGEASITLTVKAAGTNTVTATLPNGNSTTAAISGNASLRLAEAVQGAWVLAGSSTSSAVVVQLMNSGSPVSGQPINFTVTAGTGNLSVANAITNASGVATTQLTTSNTMTTVIERACPPVGAACVDFVLQPVTPSNIKIKKISGDDQLLLVGQTPQPILLRVTDSSTPANPVGNVPATISGVVYRAAGPPDCSPSDGVCRPLTQVAVSRFSQTILSNLSNGTVSYQPAIQNSWGAVRVAVIVTAGEASQQFAMQVVAPQP
ncbi:MAG: putative lipoprotein [Acidobacteriales bacterium]|nr:putative lipoprotein [Terriglobales bacterium]